MLPLDARPTPLYSSKCVDVVMDEQMRRVSITARAGSDVDAACAISGIIEATNGLLVRGQEFSVLWDLQEAPTPGYRDVMRLASWGMRNKADLERLTTRMEIVMAKGAVASIAGALLSAFSGVPTMIVADAGSM